MEVVLVTLITALGGLAVEFLRRQSGNVSELKEQIELLTGKVDKLEDEVASWMERYFKLLREVALEQHTMAQETHEIATTVCDEEV